MLGTAWQGVWQRVCQFLRVLTALPHRCRLDVYYSWQECSFSSICFLGLVYLVFVLTFTIRINKTKKNPSKYSSAVDRLDRVWYSVFPLAVLSLPRSSPPPSFREIGSVTSSGTDEECSHGFNAGPASVLTLKKRSSTHADGVEQQSVVAGGGWVVSL